MEAMSPHPIDPVAVASAQQQTLTGASERRMRKLVEVLCDTTRLKIVRALHENELAASDLARVLGRSRSATSQHLRVLREADIVQPTPRGDLVRYRLADDLNGQIPDDGGRAFDPPPGEATGSVSRRSSASSTA